MSEKTSILDLLLKPETPNVGKSLPTARYRVKRLSELLGEDVVFELRALPYGKVSELMESMSEDLSVQIVLSGVVSPDLKDPALQAKFGGATPAEIEDLSRAVERLCGYRTATIEEVKHA